MFRAMDVLSSEVGLSNNKRLVAVFNHSVLAQKQASWKPLDQEDVYRAFGKKAAEDFLSHHFLGVLDNDPCFVVQPSKSCLLKSDHFEYVPLRSLLGTVPDDYFQLAARAVQIQRWDHEHRYCGACGAKTYKSPYDRARVCGQCKMRFYPRISPCAIGLVYKGDQCLLARSSKMPEGRFSTIAGFIEAGETAEQGFVREVYEEVGIMVDDVQYMSSQSWPFPGQLMLGFIAKYRSGEIRVDGKEILEAGWYSVDTIPNEPSKTSISGHLIRYFIDHIANQSG